MNHLSRRAMFGGVSAAALGVSGADALTGPQDLLLLAGYSGRSLGNLFPAQSASEGAIRAAFSQAVAAGGGVVLIPSGTISITSALPMAAGVSYRGAGCGPTMTSPHYIASGTIIDGGGGNFNGFEYQPNDLGSPYASTALLQASEIVGCSIRDLSVQNCAYGMKFGALYQGGINNLFLDNVAASGCSQWGIWTENCHNMQTGKITIWNCGVGQFAHVASGTTLWNYGNTNIGNVISQTTSGTSKTTRGICLLARGGSFLNGLTCYNMTSIGGNIATQTIATTLNSTTSIGVTDLSYFAVGVPVFAQSAVGGFAVNTPYYVQSVSGTSGAGTITLGPNSAQAFTATITGAGPNLSVRGACALELVGLAASDHLTSIKILNTDTETCGLVAVHAETLSSASEINIGYVTAASGQYGIASHRNDSTTKFICRVPSASVLNYIDTYNVWMEGCYSSALNRDEFGFTYNNDATSSWSLRIDTNPVAMYNPDTTGLLRQIATKRVWGDAVQYVASGGTISSGGSSVVYTGAAAGNLNLPNVTGSLHIGVRFAISNPTNGTVTLNTQGSLNINNIAATTSFTLPANSVTYATLMQTASASGVYYWAVR